MSRCVIHDSRQSLCRPHHCKSRFVFSVTRRQAYPLLFAFLCLVLTIASPVTGGLNGYNTQTLTFVSIHVETGGVLQVTLRNNFNFQVNGSEYVVYTNGLDQVVNWVSASITPQGGQTVNSYPLFFMLPSGSYNATVYVVTDGGCVVSNDTVFHFVRP